MSPQVPFDTVPLVRRILREYPLPFAGPHGPAHWARVLENGLRLAEATGVDPTVVALFALFHDSKRENEHHDPDHGLRGGDFAGRLRGTLFELPDASFDRLHAACRLHTTGRIDGEAVDRVCWDADRLDLGRVGIAPDPKRLCTAAARDLLPWALERSFRAHVLEIVARWLA